MKENRELYTKYKIKRKRRRKVNTSSDMSFSKLKALKEENPSLYTTITALAVKTIGVPVRAGRVLTDSMITNFK